jgi:WD40 repeat protein
MYNLCFSFSYKLQDTTINHDDVRVRSHLVKTMQNHTQAICGLKWQLSSSKLASGGNDNLVNIWDISSNEPIYSFTDHEAAVKAMDWCPWKSDLLVTGGGLADGHLRFWNTAVGSCVNSINTHAQVSSALWSHNYKVCNNVTIDDNKERNLLLVLVFLRTPSTCGNILHSKK